MLYGKKRLFLTFLCTALAGAGLHFLYQLLPNTLTALISPVNESLWEHLKIIFWPYLAAAAFLCRGRPTAARPWLLTLSLLCALMLTIGYCYHIVLGGEAMAVDIGLYAALMALGFWLPTRFSGPFLGWQWAVPLVLIAGLGGVIVLATFFPPSYLLFTDLSGANTWFLPPC